MVQLFIFIEIYFDMKRLLPLMLLLFFCSCSIQKRHFNKGYDVQWKGTYASSSNAYSEDEPVISEPCDTIKNKDGSVVLASVERIDSKKIYISPCENSVSTLNEIDRSKVSIIHYSNGALFENKTPEQLQKEREENLQKYREDKDAYEKEMIQKEQQRLAAEKDTFNSKNSELKDDVEQQSNDVSFKKQSDEKDADEVTAEPLMRGFFIFGFALAGLTMLLSIVDPFYGALSLVGLVALFVTDVVSPFIVLASLIKKHRNKGKYKGRPVLLELLFALVSFGALLVWIYFQF